MVAFQIHDLTVSGSFWLDRFFNFNLTSSNSNLSLLASLPLLYHILDRQTIMTCCEDCDLTGIDVLVQQDIIDLVFSRVRLVDLARLTYACRLTFDSGEKILATLSLLRSTDPSPLLQAHCYLQAIQRVKRRL